MFYGVSVGLDWLSQVLTPELAGKVDAASQQIFGGLGTPIGIAALALVAGICEEILFRGALQPRLGIIVTSLIFTSVHTQYGLSFAALAVFVLACGLGLIRRFTNTTTSILCHVAYNGLVGVIGAGLLWGIGVEIGVAVALAGLLFGIGRFHRPTSLQTV